MFVNPPDLHYHDKDTIPPNVKKHKKIRNNSN